MTGKRLSFMTLAVAFPVLFFSLSAAGQSNFTFSSFRMLTNREFSMQLTAPTGFAYRIDATTNLADWGGFLTLYSTGRNLHIDSGTPYLGSRYYRASQLADSNVMTGDHLMTTNGDVVLHPIVHGSLLMTWNGKTIYSDPAPRSGVPIAYGSLPRADLVVISHSHGDHYDTNTLNAIRTNNTIILAPQNVYNSMNAGLRPFTTVLVNNASTNVMGIHVLAIPAYNLAPGTIYHSPGACNSYVLTIGGKRIFITGDTEDVSEMRNLQNIDVAFLCMNSPFTMTVSQAVSVTRQMRPKVVYPYHFANSDGTFSDLNAFKQQVGTDLGIEVRIRKWY